MSREPREMTRSKEDEEIEDEVLDEETRHTLEVSNTIEETLEGLEERPLSTGMITGLDKTIGDIIIEIETPEGKRNLKFDSDDDKRELNAFLKDAGVTKSNASAAIGQSVPVVYVNDEWHYHASGKKRDLFRTLYDADLVTIAESSEPYNQTTWTKTRRGSAALWIPAVVSLSLFLLNLFPIIAMMFLFVWAFSTLAISDLVEDMDVDFKRTRST